MSRIEEHKASFKELGAALLRLGETVREVFQAAAQAVTATARNLSTAISWKAAESWAKRTRPEWVARMKRTKKQRTRTKYTKRILREYMKTLTGQGRG